MTSLLAILRSILIVTCLAVLAGCQTMGGAGLVSSSVTAELTPKGASAISEDMVAKLAEQIGPGSTTIALRADGSVFGAALEASLRGWGYAVVTDQETGASVTEPLAYVVDPFEGGLLVRLSTQKAELTRMYVVTAEGATPASPLSVMQRGPGETT
ncbi:MAG: conjugal transfer protein TrbH [Rhizobiales bacterium]|nr:conjugal transfer protein TrbH [Hyphomicrobiales bacterium]|tara:strand:- start:28540 stop:29007 length:468 start_codon:yes stop_codon:yes gene_type:complete